MSRSDPADTGRSEGRLYGPLLVSAALGLAALAALLLIDTLGVLIGPFRFFSDPETEKTPTRVEAPSAALLEPSSFIEVGIEAVGPSRLLVRVTNTGSDTEAVSMRIRWNVPAARAVVRSTKLGQEEAWMRFTVGEESGVLLLPPLPPGHSVAYTIDLG